MNAERVDQPMPDNQGIPGKTLAAQREAMGWTVEQVADQLKLAVRQVEALEQGDYSALPPPAVVRGFVRAYAKVVKLDAAPLVAQIALGSDAPDTSPSVVRRDKPTSFSQTRFPSNGKRASKFPVGLAAIAVLLIGGAAAAWQFGLVPPALLGRASAPAAPAADAAVTVLPQPLQTQTVPEVSGAAPAAKPADALPPVISNAVPLISVPPVSTPGGSPATAANTPAGISPATPAAATPAAATAPNALIISVRENSWIEVRPVKKGRSLFSGMVKAGTIETVTVTEPVTLIVGNPGAVDATLRGVAVPLAAMPGGRVARVPLQ